MNPNFLMWNYSLIVLFLEIYSVNWNKHYNNLGQFKYNFINDFDWIWFIRIKLQPLFMQWIYPQFKLG